MLVANRMDMENQGSNRLVLLDTGSGLCRKMLVIRASVEAEYPAEGPNCVLETEFVDSI